MKRIYIFLMALVVSLPVWSQEQAKKEQPKWQGKFEQLGQLLPTPNEFRTGSGAPGPHYWQQRADYVINAELNDENQSISGSEVISYTNNSPDLLKYLWLQLDQNINVKENASTSTKTGSYRDSLTTRQTADVLSINDFTGGYQLKAVKDASGKPLRYTINQTMMRIDLNEPLGSGGKISFSIDWSFFVNDRVKNTTMNDGRSGMEYFPEDKNYLYIIGQWFPRMCVYNDMWGWQNKQFLGQGEFTLDFGNYTVNLTVPADHIVGGTGMVQNLKEVLTADQFARFEKAKNSFDAPVVICTQQEAEAREKNHSTDKKIWKFYAENVRDFAFATSRKFIWDAQAVKIGGRLPLAMSYYPKEGNPLWEQESTKAVKNTITTYSKYSLDYPYPQATSVNGASLGMEYPMICFNFGRPTKDASINARIKNGMIGVIVHEVGHNFFPMIISNDERQWTWMDEGINTFVQHRTQVENYPDQPQGRGPASSIIPYMKSSAELQRPLMVNSEQVVRRNFGNEQYAKCATALNILRETVMGPELFDKAFREYARRWAFKHPEPGDFFRTMEDASAVDLDWFWKGWFYTTDNCDVSLDKVRWFQMRRAQGNPENKEKNAQKGDLGANKVPTNFDNGPEPFSLIPTDARMYGEFQNRVDDQAIMHKLDDKNIYEITLTNKGGLVMPVIIEWTFKDGSKEVERIPVEIWRNNETTFSKVFVKDKEVTQVILDPLKETSDINPDDNSFPRIAQPSKFDELKKNRN